MSTEHQQYSTDNQLETINAYAIAQELEIVDIYTDAGKSGLRLEGRAGLQKLFLDAESSNRTFSTILVYDVSRWGRFQDPDLSASYEVRCRQAGVTVQYCAEQFANDGSPVSGIVKSLKRMMAGEYSRELSVKVFAGQARLIRLGYRQGGIAGFGLRRQIVDQHGAPKGVLGLREQKSIQTDRVVLVPGPSDELRVVRDIYREFVENGRTESEISQSLNKLGYRTGMGTAWTRGTVHQVLINEKYIGNNVWNRTSFKLKSDHVTNPQSDWVRAEGVFEAVISPVIFQAAQAIICNRSYRWTDAQMLESLRTLFLKGGFLSGLVIDEAADVPSSSAYRSRFGSLLRSYGLVGFNPARDYRFIEANRQIRQAYPDVLRQTVELIKQVGAKVEINPLTDLLRVNDEFTISLVLSRCQELASGSLRWVVKFDLSLCPDVTVAVRMTPSGLSALDYFLLPSLDMTAPKLRIAEHNPVNLEIYRFETLDILSHLSTRMSYRSIA
jgi:DNA invertase Pin-like site-specific DNA recombinase